jgi:hypothetical protein
MYCEGVGWIEQSEDRDRWVGLMGQRSNRDFLNVKHVLFLNPIWRTANNYSLFIINICSHIGCC